MSVRSIKENQCPMLFIGRSELAWRALYGIFRYYFLCTLVVQYTSRRTNGTTLSYSQSFKVALIRSGVAVGAGFLIGRLFSVMISKGFLNKDVLTEQPLVVAGIVAFCHAMFCCDIVRALVLILPGNHVWYPIGDL